MLLASWCPPLHWCLLPSGATNRSWQPLPWQPHHLRWVSDMPCWKCVGPCSNELPMYAVPTQGAIVNRHGEWQRRRCCRRRHHWTWCRNSDCYFGRQGALQLCVGEDAAVHVSGITHWCVDSMLSRQKKRSARWRRLQLQVRQFVFLRCSGGSLFLLFAATQLLDLVRGV